MTTVRCCTCGADFDPEREGAARLLYDWNRRPSADGDVCPTCSVRHLAVRFTPTLRERGPCA